MIKRIINFLLFLPRMPILLLIKLYQKTISPDHGLFKRAFPYGYCRFYPTCSEYGYQTIKKNGLVVGGFKAAWRILRCNPWGKGGEDLP
ncbi:MAG: membrane protein insertion efficiency factor YidD [Candidatus Magasanikbacteria bacterium]|nr:membrane protein insertion efficiency factor YidD [Candidatus Magasanikbacteria bacterium]